MPQPSSPRRRASLRLLATIAVAASLAACANAARSGRTPDTPFKGNEIWNIAATEQQTPGAPRH